MTRNALIIATATGLVLQLAMVVAGHYVPFIKDKGFAVGGMLFSLIAGALYVRLVHGAWPDSLLGGAVAGGVCAFIGIAASVALSDTPMPVLAFGTVASVVTGLIGAALAKLFP